MMAVSNISSEFPYQSQFATVHGARLHYISEGKGDPMLFLHGIPTSNYLWRNIIPFMSDKATCIAPDLIGMGKSDKPDIDYSIHDHIDYIEQFIDSMGLDNITMVLHGWGSLIGFDYAMRNPNKIKALAFYESHVRPVLDWSKLSLPVQEFAAMLKDKDDSYQAIMYENFFIKKHLQRGAMRKLTAKEIEVYQAPFKTADDCRPLWQFTQDFPKGEGPSEVVDLIANYSKRLEASQHPKLLMYSIPGFITTIETVKWCKDHLPNLTLTDVGEAMHFQQESDPQQFGSALKDWFETKVLSIK